MLYLATHKRVTVLQTVVFQLLSDSCQEFIGYISGKENEFPSRDTRKMFLSSSPVKRLVAQFQTMFT